MNKKGFTLVELLAVIAVLAIVIGIASISAFTVMTKAKINTAKENTANLKDAAITYCIDNNKIKKATDTCTVSVTKLIEDGIFQDTKHRCDRAASIVVSITRQNQADEDYKATVSGYAANKDYEVCNK